MDKLVWFSKKSRVESSLLRSPILLYRHIRKPEIPIKYKKIIMNESEMNSINTNTTTRQANNK